MAEVVIKHSSGMISVDAEYRNPSVETIDRLKRTDLYRQLVRRVGEDRASVLVEGHPTTSVPENIGQSAGNR